MEQSPQHNTLSKENPKTPTEIAYALGVDAAHMGNTARDAMDNLEAEHPDYDFSSYDDSELSDQYDALAELRDLAEDTATSVLAPGRQGDPGGLPANPDHTHIPRGGIRYTDK